MILERGDMWSVFGKTDLFLITTNPIIRKDGAVVMGRGIAKEAATRFPSLPYDFAKQYKAMKHEQEYIDALCQYHVGPIGKYDGQLVGWFMVKTHWQLPADLEEIQWSTKALCKWDWVDRIDLNFPGIGNGKLAREDVLPIIEQLPDNVHVWEYGE